MFETIVGEGCAAMRQQAEAALGHHDLPLHAALPELGLHWLRFMLRPQVRGLHRVMVAEGIRFPALARAFYAAGPQAMLHWLTAWMQGEQARGRVAAGVPPAQTAEQFLALLRGDLFVRATLGLVAGETPPAELRRIAELASASFLRLHGALPAGAPPGAADTTPRATDGFA